jgi:PhnB protein
MTKTDAAQIRHVIADWAEALRNKDSGGVVSHHAAGFVQFSLAPPLISTAADAAGLEAWFATWDGPIGYEVHDLEIAAGGDVAFAYGLVRLSGTKTTGEKALLWFRLTLGLRKTGDAWKILHEHESVPFTMDGTYRAAIDLEP